MTNIFKFFRTGENKPVIMSKEKVAKVYNRKRWEVYVSLVLGYGFFYTCRLSLSVAKKPMIDEGILDAHQLGIIGSILLFVYGFGKFTNGFLSDRANIRRFISTGLLVSAVINLIFGFTSAFWLFAVLWGFNGWFQSIGSAPCVVSLCQWFSNKERGMYYGFWAGAHNLGEGLTFILTATLISFFGWRWGFWGSGAVCVVVALLLFRFLADRPETYGLPHVSDYKNDYSAGKPCQLSVGKAQLEVLKTPAVWILGLSCAMMYVTRYMMDNWGILYLQEAKGYSLIEAGFVLSSFTIMGLIGALSSGFLSDKLFKAKRNFPTLIYGLIGIASLIMLREVPAGHKWLDVIAVGGFGISIGALIVFLGGLTAIDLCSKKAAGAVKGTIGLFAYIGASLQDLASGYLLDSNKIVVNGVSTYDFDSFFHLWIGAAIASMLLALFVWNAKPKE